MKIVRIITYEGGREQIIKQMERSIPDGTYDWLTKVTINTLMPVQPNVDIQKAIMGDAGMFDKWRVG